MTWFAWLHHTSIHVPLVMSTVLGILGIWVNRRDDQTVWVILRIAGWATTATTLVAVVSGLATATEFWTEVGPDVLIHHRNLGILGFVSMLTAVGSIEYGLRTNSQRVRRFGALCWIAVALSMVGAGHWGGSGVHSDRIPWDGQTPALRAGEK